MASPDQRLEDAIAMIGTLVGFPSVSDRPNRPLAEHVSAWLDDHGIAHEVLWNAEGSKGTVWATVGPADRPGVILSAHSDVVPVTDQAWHSDPFTLRRAGGRLYGRGAADMKGFAGTVLSALPRLAALPLRRPVHFALSYDEEVGCTGVLPLLDRLAGLEVKPALCIVGEPTEMRVVTGHKAVGMYEITVTGLPVHSARAPHGLNAISVAADLVRFVDALAAEKAAAARPDGYEIAGPTLSVNRIDGGSALNIVPGRCRLVVDIRAPQDGDLEALLDRLHAHADDLRRALRQSAPSGDIVISRIVHVPGLATTATAPAARFAASLLPEARFGTVEFGTEAGAFMARAGIDSVVCGPGSMAQGHQPDEYIEIDQLQQLLAMLDRLGAALCRPGEGPCPPR